MQAQPHLNSTYRLLAIFATLIAVCTHASAAQPDQDQTEPRLNLENKTIQGGNHNGETVRTGTYAVYENRAAQAGRMLKLRIMILPAQPPAGTEVARDPIFILAGGPGVDAYTNFRGYLDSPLRAQRDIVFISQRGTADQHALRCTTPANDENIQGYLDELFNENAIRNCLEQLQTTADLTHYGTPEAMDDYDEIRDALGYETINLMGGSYGTRAALVYMRRHPQTIRTAVLNGVAPIQFTNPLYHASAAQDALDDIFDIIEKNQRYDQAYGNIRNEFQTILERLDEAPADATVKHPTTDEDVNVKLSRQAFGGALRVMMYYNNRDVPRLIHRAFRGDFDAFAQRGIEVSRSLRHIIAIGMLLCVTCAEDIPRIEPKLIPLETANTFYGDGRVRQQIAMCAFWPRSELPEDFGDPVSVEIPVLLLSGTLDPVTPPRWGETAASTLKNGLHLTVPGTHGVSGPCLQSIIDELLETGATAALETDCTQSLRMWQFNLPKTDDQ